MLELVRCGIASYIVHSSTCRILSRITIMTRLSGFNGERVLSEVDCKLNAHHLPASRKASRELRLTLTICDRSAASTRRRRVVAAAATAWMSRRRSSGSSWRSPRS